MFIERLIISSDEGIIRDIKFHIGLNLIVDETPIGQDINLEKIKDTGNNIGKTTVLKLIDFCLGGDPKEVYIDNETKREITLVKDFLQKRKVVITLILTDDLLNEESPNKITIKRNFLNYNQKIMSINGENLPGNKGEDFLGKLDSLIITNRKNDRPTFREIISHSIRYSDNRINNTLKVLSNFTSLAEYEALYLYLFGIDQVSRSKMIKKIATENEYKKRLEKTRSLTELELTLSILNNEINKIENKRKNLNVNENYENDMKTLNEIKYYISQVSSKITDLTLRKNIILDAEMELRKEEADIDLVQLKLIYQQASNYLGEMQKTFEDLVKYHNNMIIENIRFITQELPELEAEITYFKKLLEDNLAKERDLTTKVINSDTFKDLEILIKQLNELYRKKGEVDNSISQIKTVNENINALEEEISTLDNNQFNDSFIEKVKEKLMQFNDYFSDISSDLYDENYAITYRIKKDKKSKKDIYEFISFNANSSSGKKQGEILCFDIAYILFADSKNIPVLHFILNDKKELMHGNQIVNVNEYIKGKNIQLVISILRDKIPPELNTDDLIILKLSQTNKLFKIEE